MLHCQPRQLAKHSLSGIFISASLYIHVQLIVHLIELSIQVNLYHIYPNISPLKHMIWFRTWIV